MRVRVGVGVRVRVRLRHLWVSLDKVKAAPRHGRGQREHGDLLLRHGEWWHVAGGRRVAAGDDDLYAREEPGEDR